MSYTSGDVEVHVGARYPAVHNNWEPGPQLPDPAPIGWLLIGSRKSEPGVKYEWPPRDAPSDLRTCPSADDARAFGETIAAGTAVAVIPGQRILRNREEREERL